jgi:hypothetical protein
MGYSEEQDPTAEFDAIPADSPMAPYDDVPEFGTEETEDGEGTDGDLVEEDNDATSLVPEPDTQG